MIPFHAGGPRTKPWTADQLRQMQRARRAAWRAMRGDLDAAPAIDVRGRSTAKPKGRPGTTKRTNGGTKP